ncbi:MAG: hypothetical protein KAV44_03565 [Bacteroidales bacterium]|jgi:uncharacterized membrane protein YjjP (DUF1212 family)|nr:hypothetical protein [Bacteroidales bacterium]
MEKRNIIQDDFLKNLIQISEIEKPSENFTNKVMGKIQSEVKTISVADEPLLSKKYWLLIAAGFIAVLIILFVFDLSFITNLFTGISVDKIEIPIITGNLVNSFRDIFSSIKISSISIVVIAAIASLFLLDKFLKKKITTNIFVI